MALPRPTLFTRAGRREVRAAPWQTAAPLALVAIAALCTGLLVADAGGWSQVWPSSAGGSFITYLGGDDPAFRLGGDPYTEGTPANWLMFYGDTLFVGLSAALVVAALAGWRWLTLPVLVALGAALAGWVQTEQRLRYVTVVFRDVKSGSQYDGQIETSITMAGVVAVLLGVGLLTALVWAVSGSRDRRRLSTDERRARRRRWQRSVLIGVGAVLLTLAAPRVAVWLSRTGADLFPTSESPWDPTQTIYLLFVAMGLTFVLAPLLPRWSPGAAIALVIVAAALWIPFLWMLIGLTMVDAIPLSGLVGEGAAVLLFWAYTAIGGLALGAWAVARASRAANPGGAVSA